MDEDEWGSHHGDGVENPHGDHGEATFGFPILDNTTYIVMKNIPLFVFPQFHGMPTKDPDAFLFEFDKLSNTTSLDLAMC